jgi:5-methyltetrahydropteroyltriglutamate--homocysteine methyltransferase
MIGCYVTGTLPRPSELIEVTRAYDRGRVDERGLRRAFEEGTFKVIDAQLSAGFTHITDGMLRWQDLFRGFTENLIGLKVGNLTRWFNNNTFYRKPLVVSDLKRKKSVVEGVTYVRFLPKNFHWKAILPAPYTFVQLSENQFYKDKTEFMFRYAKILREEIEQLVRLGFDYVQLSDPALVYEPIATSLSRDELDLIDEALRIAIGGIPIKTCLQTFFGDFSQILPKALDFPVDHVGIDLYETKPAELKEHTFEKGVALGLVDSRSSIVETQDELVRAAKKIIRAIYRSKTPEVFVCPNCDLEFLPWEKAEKKIRVLGSVAKLLRREFCE